MEWGKNIYLCARTKWMTPYLPYFTEIKWRKLVSREFEVK